MSATNPKHQAPLSDFCKITQGGKSGLSGKHFVDDGYPAYGAGGLNGYLGEYEFEEPAIILSSIGARCGKCFLPKGKWASLANTQLIFPDPSRADIRFVWYQLNDESSWHRSGTGQPFIKPSDVKSRSVYLPPFPEQRRIADILDKADAIRRKRQEAQAMAGQLRRSLYLSTFGDPIANPLNWQVTQFGDVCVRMHQGINTVADKVEYTESGYPIIQSKHFTKGTLDLSDTRFVSESDFARYRDKYAPQPNDLLVANIGTIGKTLRVNEDSDFLIAWNVFLVKLNHSAVCPRFAQCFLEELAQRQFFDQFMTGGTVKFVNKTTMSTLPLPLPPMPLQIKFEKQLETVDVLLASTNKGCSDADVLFNSLVQRAFRGEL